MVLNGSLHEFILADILQLLSQQKVTGRLALTSENRTGFLVLQQGMVIAAETDRENLQTKLINCLLALKRVPEAVVNELAITDQNATLDRATAELSARQYLSQQELSGIVRILIEDFSCTLFTWSTGEYRFESLENAGMYLVPGVTLSADYIVMEAMRRVDELKRMKLQIQDDMIFVRAQPPAQPYRVPPDLVGLLNNPNDYVLAFINGMSTVGMIAERSFTASYRLHESLCTLWDQQQIAPLSSKISRSIQAALKRKKDQTSHKALQIVASVSVTLLIVVAILVAGLGIRLAAGMLLTAIRSPASDPTGRIELALEKKQAGALEFQSQYGTVPKGDWELVKDQFLSNADVAGLYQSSALSGPK